MFVIRVFLEISDDSISAFETAAQKEAQAVRSRFPACHAYHFSRTLGQQAHYILYEEWQDEETFSAYRKSDFFSEVGQRLRPLLASPPDSAYYKATRVPLQ